LFNDYPKDFSWWYRFNKNLLYTIGAKKSDILTTVSSHSKKSIQKYLGVKTEHIHVLPNGINQKYFMDYNKEEAAAYVEAKFGCKKYILFSSRIEPRKNHVALLQAYLDLKLYAEGYQLVFIGHQSIKVPVLDHLLQSISQEIRQKIILLHDINDEALFAFYKAATVFIYPSKAEGFGFPPLEAAALKIPVLCSNSAALNDFTFFNQNLIDISDDCLFKKRLLDLIQQKEETSLQAIAHTIKQKYDWEKTAERFYRLLKNHHAL
jgi:glycosyltransferase involved in cell wall biosynthesis